MKRISILQIIAAQLPEKVKKFLERDEVQGLLIQILPIGPMLALALRKLASRVAKNKLAAGGPIHDALNRVLAPQMANGTDQKIFFDLQGTGTPSGQSLYVG